MKNIFLLLALILCLACNSKKHMLSGTYSKEVRGELILLDISDFNSILKSACSGLVLDQLTKKSMPFVYIQLSNSLFKYQSHTDSSGIFLMENIECGTYEIELSLIGYFPFKDSISIASGKNNNYQIELQTNKNIKL